MESSLVGGLRHAIAEHWWVLLLRGLVYIALGLMAFFTPGITLASLILLIGICCLVDGIASIAGGPGVTAMVLLYLSAFWAIARGVLEIIAAIEFRKVIEGELLLGLAGLLSIAFGVFIVMSPGAGALSIVWVLGAYALVFGITLVILSFRVKSLA
jgi:uncharacterized membrane protein HdeD (DUF308 family)